MALMTGSLCVNCESRPARDQSHYCTDKCGLAFAKAQKGPVRCEGGETTDCMVECDTVAEARRAKWKSIQPDPEGMCWNWTGVCPACQVENAA